MLWGHLPEEAPERAGSQAGATVMPPVTPHRGGGAHKKWSAVLAAKAGAFQVCESHQGKSQDLCSLLRS
jgi:hypothetical protein